ncbi:MAG: aromatic hydrocarbon degradation protein [Spirochaetae bacterium HGW-Spirochaetae-1]|jgi:long-chain fatty acid transport protein|nr:MAG: aromatic hydrocarbon degradation protein [Spirochaetae bacterium HGW-Spirochaetae-1]
MKKYKVMSLLSVLSLLIASNAFATNGMRLIGFGPVQRAMGGVGVSATLDGASTLTNPAGMVDLKGRIDFGATYFSPFVTLETGGGDIDSDKGASPVPAFGLIIPTAIDNLSFGVGAYGVSGMGVDFNLSAMSMIMYTSYSLMRFTPGVAYKIMDMISVGATANIMYATMEYSMNLGGGQMSDMGASAFGGGFTLGVQVKPIEMVTIGFVYESTSWFQNFKFNQYIDGGTVTENSMDFNQPMNLTAGVSAEPIKGLIIAFDLQWIQWSETNGNNKPAFTGGNMDMDWEDQIVYKVGVQYAVIPLVTVRAGVNYGKSPVPSSSKDANQYGVNAAFPAITEWHITGGLGLNLSEKLEVNLGAMFAPEASLAVGALGKVKMTQYSLDAGVGYKF